ncbi:MAG: HEAT repeat domain-containing protein, partial [Acidimicrobiia bacterium]
MAVTMANALGMAWATFQLYPEPSGQVGFDRAIQDLAGSIGIEQLEVGPRAFIWDRSEVPSTHAGVGRIVERLFANSVAAVRFVSSPSAKELVGFFEVIRRTPDELEDQGGPAASLREAGVHSIRLLERRILNDEEPEDEQRLEDGAADPRDVLHYKGDPEALAAYLLATAGDDSSALAALVIDTYSRALEVIDQQDVWEHEEIVHTFVDMFFYFPPRHQAPLISELLARQSEPPFRVFLDQFASHELNELAPFLDSQAHPLLLEYARIAGRNADRGKEIIDLLNESEPGDSIDTIVDRRIAAVLKPGSGETDASGSGALARLAARRADSPDNSTIGIGVVQRLLSVAESEADTHRVLRIWAGKTVGAVRDRDLGSALTWLRGVSDPRSTDNATGSASQALQIAIEMDVAVELAEALHESPESAVGTELLRGLAPHVTDHLVELLGSEEDRGRRRGLIAMVVEVSRNNPARVIAHLDDPRWYLVRNLAIVLSRCRHPDVIRDVLPLASHSEPRVRREALRAIYALTRHTDIGPFIDGLADPEESVRTVAATLLRNCDDG